MTNPSATQIVYDAIVKFIHDYGMPPTIRELMEKTGLSSTSVVKYHLDKMRAFGLLTFHDGKARSIRLLTEEILPMDGHEILTPQHDPQCVVPGCTEPRWRGPRGINMALTKCENHQRMEWRNAKARKRGQGEPAQPRPKPPIPKKGTPHTGTFPARRQSAPQPPAYMVEAVRVDDVTTEALALQFQAVKDEVMRLWNEPHNLYGRSQLVQLVRLVNAGEEATK